MPSPPCRSYIYIYTSSAHEDEVAYPLILSIHPYAQPTLSSPLRSSPTLTHQFLALLIASVSDPSRRLTESPSRPLSRADQPNASMKTRPSHHIPLLRPSITSVYHVPPSHPSHHVPLSYPSMRCVASIGWMVQYHCREVWEREGGVVEGVLP
jgi:hypothetical protein